MGGNNEYATASIEEEEALPQHRDWDDRMLYRYNGFWFPDMFFRGVLNSRNNFKARETDIILASMPKAGTTWLKALVFSIVNRAHNNQLDKSPLLVSNPHDLVPFLEISLYMDNENPNLDGIPSPRIFATHVPHRVLPNSINKGSSGCKIIYICRNPLDQFVSFRHFMLKNRFKPEEEPLSLEESFEAYCDGVHPFGPFWDHMLEYYEAEIQNPDRVMFLKYEELKEDVVSGLVKVAEFIGLPFSEEERERGVVEEIASICSFEHLRSLDVNVKEGNKQFGVVPNTSFFRKGEVGDWKNHLTGEMAMKVERILEEKLSGTAMGLTFESYLKSVSDSVSS